MELDRIERFASVFEAARRGIGNVVKGQDRVIEGLLTAFFAGGHALVEGPPGTGKTLLASSLGVAFGAACTRVQFTPDLMPADIVGTTVYDAASGKFALKRGPVFTDILLADEVNRAPAKTQAALLEAMQERRVSIDGSTTNLGPGFFVVATQNPIEMEGTYRLPEAEVDRFLVKLDIGYPEEASELELLAAVCAGYRADRLDTGPVPRVAESGELESLRETARGVAVDEALLAYVIRLVRATRAYPGVELGCSPRGGVSLLAALRVAAASRGRAFATPDDVKSVAPSIIGHRIMPSPEAELEGLSGAKVVAAILERTEVPR
ncbi:MAG TPA: MoxR family ATPase [Spirochaetia bacterium]|nr:MoxR family ATPase [Spirochaetia bacterium]HRZ65427.1 MoxR family ATPase [Spirochaetia bacterium]